MRNLNKFSAAAVTLATVLILPMAAMATTIGTDISTAALTASGSVDFSDADADTLDLGDANDTVTILGDIAVTDSQWSVTAAGVGTFAQLNVGNVSNTELGYLDGVTSALQTQLDGKEASIAAGTTAQYWRGDKSWQTLDKSAVGLGNVENTALSTWAGSSNVTTLGTVATGTWNGSTVGVAYGGTGLTSIATGGILYASSANTLSALAAGTNGQVLTLAGGVPTWAATAEADTLASVTGRGATTATASSFTGGAVIRGLSLDTATATDDIIQLLVTPGGAVRFTSALSAVDQTAVRNWTLPDASGTVVTTGNLTSIVGLGTVSTGTWQATAIAPGYGGTGLSAYTLGDLLYASAASTISKLAGNTSTTKMFLTQTGDGANSAAPAWGSLASADLPTVLGSSLQNTPTDLGAADVSVDLSNSNASYVTHLTIDGQMTATSFKLGISPSAILDSSGNPVLRMSATGSAVNMLTATNAATGSGPSISVDGSDTNINLNLSPKGTGVVAVSGNLSVTGFSIHNVGTLTAFNGGGQASATAITTEVANVNSATSANDSVKLPSAVNGMVVYVTNHSGVTIDVYSDGIDTLNGAAATPVPLLTNAAAICVGTTGAWECVQ